MESLLEMSPYLNVDARIDLKTITLDYIRGISGSRDGVLLITKCHDIVDKLVLLTIKDKSDLIRKEALLSLVNIAAEEELAGSVIKLQNELPQSECETTFVQHLLDMVLDESNKLADLACMLLCNVTRSPENLERCRNEIVPKLPRLLDAFSNTKYSKVQRHLNYLGPLFSNLSASDVVQKWLCEYKGDDALLAVRRLASFCHYKDSTLRRGGAAGTLRNICFDVSRHSWLLESEVDILPYLVLPLSGGEEYPDDEMNLFPPSLQYLPPDTQRELDPDIRILLLESLNRLCAKRPGREYLRNHGVYYILRELHKWEKDRKALLACESVVDILIRKEEEMEVEDIRDVQVPQEYTERFQNEDGNFINN